MEKLTKEEKNQIRAYSAKSISDKQEKYRQEQLEYSNCKELWQFVKKDPAKKLSKMLFVITKWFSGYGSNNLPDENFAQELTFERYTHLAKEYEEKIFPSIKKISFGEIKEGRIIKKRYSEKEMAEEILSLLENTGSDDIAAFALRMLLYNVNPMTIDIPSPEPNLIPYVATEPELPLNEKEFEEMGTNDETLRDVLALMQGTFFADFGNFNNKANVKAIIEKYLKECGEKGESQEIIEKKRHFLDYYFYYFEHKIQSSEFGKAMATINRFIKKAEENLAGNVVTMVTSAINERIQEIIKSKDSIVIPESINIDEIINKITPQIMQQTVYATLKSQYSLLLRGTRKSSNSEAEKLLEEEANKDPLTKAIFDEVSKALSDEEKSQKTESEKQIPDWLKEKRWGRQK